MSKQAANLTPPSRLSRMGLRPSVGASNRVRGGVVALALGLTTPLVAPAFGQAPAEVQATTNGVDIPTNGLDATTSGSLDFDLGSGLDDIALLELDVPIVVTASRRAQRITTVPQAMTVITAEDIRLSGARTIPDALRLSAGVDVADGGMSQQAVSIRGSHGFLATGLLVLVDGRQIFDAMFGGTVWNAWPFHLEDIERIEVLRGPGGVTWGANAVNGVINIITKDPADQLGFRLSSSAASRGTARQYFGYGLREEKLRLRVSGSFDRTDGFREGGNLLAPLDDRQNAGSFALHGVYESSPRHKLVISAGTKLVDGGLSNTIFHIPTPQNTASQAHYVLARWQHQEDEDHQSEITAFINSSMSQPGSSGIDFIYHQAALQYMRTVRASDAHTLTWGIDTRFDLVDATNSDPYMLREDRVRTAILGAYIQDEWRFAPRWTLNLGGRLDYDSYGGFEPSARAALTYELSDTSALYASVSRSFSMPPAASRFVNEPALGGLFYVTADPGVDARKVLAYEVGYRSRLGDRFDLSANIFWNEYADHLGLPIGLGPPGLAKARFENVGDASVYGAEVEGRLQATPRLELLANYSYENLNWRAGIPYHLTDLITPPRHKAMAGARYRMTDDLVLSTHLYFVDAVLAPQTIPIVPRKVNAYLRWDIRGEWEFWEDRASIAMGVRNLLDDGHFEGGSAFLNDAEVPRMIFAEFRLEIPAGK